MASLATVAAVLIGLGAGAVAGWFLGEAVRGAVGRYWVLSLAAVAVCMALDFAGLAQGIRWLSSGALGVMAGMLAGLRFGFLDTVGKLRRPGD